MEAMSVSKKRKQTSSSSSFSQPLMMGITTRSKSRLHLHCNRSGCTRSESIRKRPRSRNRKPGYSGDDNVLLHTPIKDLRSRRVFSPNSVSSMNSRDREFEGEDDGNASKNGGFETSGDGFSCHGRNVDEEKVSENGRTEKMNLGFVSEAQNSDDRSPKLALVGEFDGVCDLEQNSKPIENTVEERAQTTLERPDDLEVKGKPSDGNAQNGVHKVYSGSKANLALKPCFQQKLFKTPGSVSYRRLLPYLMGIAENNSSALKIDQRPKLDNGLKDKEFLASVAPRNEEAFNKRFNRDMDLMDCRTGRSDTLPKIVLDFSNEPSRGDKLNSGSLGNTIESPCGAVVDIDNRWSKPPVNGQIKKMDVEFSSNDQESPDLDRRVSMIAADMLSVKDNVIGAIGDDDSKPAKNETSDSDNEFSCKVQNEKTANINLSSVRDDRPSCKDKELGQCSEDSGLSLGEVVKFFYKECHQEVQNMNQLKQCEDESKVLHQIDHPNEESIQMTPPDTDIFDKQDIEIDRVDRGEYLQHNKDNVLGRMISRTNSRNATLNDSRNYKVVLNPLSRLKVFKSPGSISYRRLLPFLTNMANNNAGDSADDGCLKSERDLEEKLVSPTLGSNNHEIPMEKSSDSGFDVEYQTCDPGPTLTDAATNASDDKEPNRLSPENSTGIQIPVDSGKEQQLQIEGIVSDKASKLETSPGFSSSLHEPDLPVITLHPMNFEASSEEECASSLVSKYLNVDREADLSRSVMESSDGVKEIDVEGLCPSQSPSEIPISSRVPAAGLKKGILKRNPRGCRGLCTCLNCSSFRLHAERSFEFSRNHMEDAKEMALDLIKELSNLRSILEKSAEGADDHVVHFNKVKEACNKAFEAEEQAKFRLNQMNDDVNIHCRIPCLERPKVRFATCIKGKVISRANYLSN